MQLIQIWTPGNTKIGSGYRSVWVLSTGRKWVRIFDALNNDHVKIRPSQLKDMFVKNIDINLRYWVMFLANKVTTNKHYRDIFKWISTLNRDMDTQILTELVEIKMLLHSMNNYFTSNAAGVTKAELQYIEAANPVKPFLGGVTKPAKKKDKAKEYLEQKEEKKQWKKEVKARRGRPPGAKGKKK